MLDKVLRAADQLNTGWTGFILDNWLVLAVLLILLGFALDQLLYCLRYKPWKRWMHSLRVLRRFLEKIFRVSLPWPADVQPSPLSPGFYETSEDPDAPRVVRAPEAEYRPLPPKRNEAPYSPLPRPGRTAARNADAEPVTLRPAQKQNQERPTKQLP